MQTFQDLCLLYFNDKKNQKKTSTVQSDQYCLKKFQHLYQMEASSITCEQIDQVLSKMDENGLKTSYINKVRSAIQKIFYYAVNEEYLSVNPMKKVAIYKKPDEITQEMHFWTYSEFLTFCEHFDQVKDERYYTLFVFLYYTGCRKGEALALKWEDIDFEKKLVKISKTLAQQLRGCSYKLTPPKTRNSIRRIRLPFQLIEVLEKRYVKLSHQKGFSQSFFIFNHQEPLGLKYIGPKFHYYAKNAGVPLIRVHDLRHSHASLLINNGANIKAIASRLGDNVDTILSVYTHLFQETEDELVQIIENLAKTDAT